jgi:hypothetical protein
METQRIILFRVKKAAMDSVLPNVLAISLHIRANGCLLGAREYQTRQEGLSAADSFFLSMSSECDGVKRFVPW